VNKPYISPMQQFLQLRRAADRRRVWRFLVASLFVALWAYGAAQQSQDAREMYSCDTDAECETTCLDTLQPDESPDVCEVKL
jgi:hypothetical protein